MVPSYQELLDALRPFARYEDQQKWPQKDNNAYYGIKRAGAHQITYGDFRRASKLVKQADGLKQKKETTMNGIGWAVKQMQNGSAVAREGWNGKGMFIVLMPRLQLPPYSTQGTDRKVNDRTAKWIGEDAPLDCQPYIAMYTATKQWQPGWLCSQADLLATDWVVVDDNTVAKMD